MDSRLRSKSKNITVIHIIKATRTRGRMTLFLNREGSYIIDHEWANSIKELRLADINYDEHTAQRIIDKMYHEDKLWSYKIIKVITL